MQLRQSKLPTEAAVAGTGAASPKRVRVRVEIKVNIRAGQLLKFRVSARIIVRFILKTNRVSPRVIYRDEILIQAVTVPLTLFTTQTLIVTKSLNVTVI